MRLGLALFAVYALLNGQDRLADYLNAGAQRQLGKRKSAIAEIRTEAQARERIAESRARILKEIGGLPDYRGPLNAVVTKKLDQGKFTIENVHFESLPAYLITANLYLPKTRGKHPAVLFSMGHWDSGKYAGQRICANLAAKGFVVLAYDPVGQGERQQAFDARLGRTLIGGSTEQHFAAGAQALLAGESVARYFIHDSRRALDYLVSRPEVDAARMGATGCSGGGTQTTFVAALDERVKVAAPACYMNSFEVLFTGAIGDSEQSFPGFLADGLDQADWVFLFAPKPWLISSTEQDFFTPAGAKIVYEQARAFYKLFSAEDRVKWTVGPGGHGTPLVVREGIYEWMIRWLMDGKGNSKEEEVLIVRNSDLDVFPSGIAPGRGLSEVISESWSRRLKPANVKQLVELGGQATGLTKSEWLGPENATELFVVIHHASQAKVRAEFLAGLGCRVLLIALPGYPIAKDDEGRLSGAWINHTRAWLAGQNLPSIRANDLLLAIRPQLDRFREVYLHGVGAGAVNAIYAAHAEPRIAGIWLDRAPLSLSSAMLSPLHRGLHEAIIPGLALGGDFKDFTDGRFFWSDPTDWMDNPLRNVLPAHYRRTTEDTDADVLAAFRKH